MYDVKSNSFSKWKEGAWAPGCAIEIGLAVVDLRELPGVEDALSDEKSTPYFYSVMAAYEKRGSPLFAEVQRWLFIFGSESPPTPDDGVCEQPRGLQVVARGLC